MNTLQINAPLQIADMGQNSQTLTSRYPATSSLSLRALSLTNALISAGLRRLSLCGGSQALRISGQSCAQREGEEGEGRQEEDSEGCRMARKGQNSEEDTH